MVKYTEMSQNIGKSIKEGEAVAKSGLIWLGGLVGLKLVAGFLTGIVILYVDALSSAADVLSLFASYIGLKLSRKSGKKGFQYGYYKVETFAALIVSLTILYLGYKVIMESVQRLTEPGNGQHTLIGVFAILISVITSMKLAKTLMAAGQKANSLSLIANAKDKKMDVLSAMAVLTGIIANYFRIPYVEGGIGILLSIFIIKVGAVSAKEALYFLLDYWDDMSLVRKIKKVLKQEGDLVKNIKRIRLRRAGTFIFGEAYLEINPFSDMKDLRNDLRKLGEKVKETNPHIKDFIIYEMIPRPRKIRIAIPVMENRGLHSKIANSLSAMTHYIFVDIQDGKIKRHIAEKFTFGKKEDYVRMADLLKKKKVNILVNNDLNSLLYYQLQHLQHIGIYPKFSNIDKVNETIKLLLIDT